MKNVLLKTIPIVLFLISDLSHSQITLIPDANFENALISLGIDSDGIMNGQVLTNDIENITHLELQNFNNIESLSGLEAFINLTHFYFNASQYQYNTIDFSNNMQLHYIDIQRGLLLNTVNVSNCSYLDTLILNHNSITNLDLTNNANLEFLSVGNPDIDTAPFTNLSALDLSQNSNLKDLRLTLNSNLESLDLSHNPLLETLYVGHCNLASLDLSYNTQLNKLVMGIFIEDFLWDSSNPLLTELDLSYNTQLQYLDITSTSIINLDLSTNISLETFICENGFLESLNLKNNTNSILDVYVYQTPSLQCIEVDNAIAANNNSFPYSNWNIEHDVTYTEGCYLGTNSYEFDTIISYPNPVVSYIHFSETIPIIKSVTVYTLNGIKVKQASPINQHCMDISTLNSGIYLLLIKTAGHAFTHKIIKQ